MTTYSFLDDYSEGCHPDILAALTETNLVQQTAYGDDAYCEEARALIRSRNEAVPMGHMGDAWDVAYAALFLASDEAKYITATELIVDGGITACL